MSALAFPELSPAAGPAEVRGRGRGDIRLLVATRSDGALEPARFDELPRFLLSGDLLVVNDSATIPAALAARQDGVERVVHLSTPLGAGRWVVEVRDADLGRCERPELGSRLELPGRGWLRLVTEHRGSRRLSEAELVVPGREAEYLARHGSPIRYRHSPESWPLAAHQTIFARAPGSAEMPSAGRAFTRELVAALLSHGVLIAPITLHAGVSSLEHHELPPAERYRVPPSTALAVNAVHDRGGRVVAVGTTVVRALETTAAADGPVEASAGWTDLVVTPERGLRCVDGLLTGWHEPESSHLWMLAAAAGEQLLERSYVEAAALGLRGHEFGDAHLILP